MAKGGVGGGGDVSDGRLHVRLNHILDASAAQLLQGGGDC